MAEFTVTTIIDRPQEDVFVFMSDPANATRWQSGTRSAEWISEGPIGVGSVFRGVTRLLGREMTIDAEITRWDPPNAWDAKGASGPLIFAISNLFEPADDGTGTRLTQTFRNEVGGVFRFAEGLVVRQLKREVTADGQALKELLEAGETETSP